MSAVFSTLTMRLVALAIAIAATSAGPAYADKATSPTAVSEQSLRELIRLARKNYPGMRAAEHALSAMERQLDRAKYAWIPQARIRGLFSPAPRIRCLDANNQPNTLDCVRTEPNSNTTNGFNIAGVAGRLEADIGMPLYTFDKILSAKRAAKAGVKARRAQLQAAGQDVALKVVRAYWGVKLAREILMAISEGEGHLSKAIKRIDTQLEKDEGDATVPDLLRLKTAAAELRARKADALKLERASLAGLAILTGQKDAALKLDKAQLWPVSERVAPLKAYIDAANKLRPEVKLLNAAVSAGRAKADLEFARFFPDFLFVATVGVGAASTVDRPQNFFYNNPFNFVRAGFGLALNWTFDPVQQYAKYKSAKADAKRILAKRDEGLLGIRFEVRQIYLGIKTSLEKLNASRKGQRAAKSWLAAAAQNFAAGLAESKDLNDALVAFFKHRLSYLQAIFELNYSWARLSRAVGDPKAKNLR